LSVNIFHLPNITDMFKKITLLVIVLIGHFLFLNAQNSDLYFTDYPTLTPDASTIIFSHEGDLWKMPISGGLASKITSMEGNETLADVFIMPLEGGDIQQLTYHQATDRVSSWSWDNSTIYFSSNRENRVSTYAVTINGGTPKRLFPHYFNNIHNLVEHPQTGEFFFNETWESDNFENRKRYKGA